MSNLIEKRYYQLFENLTEGFIFYFQQEMKLEGLDISNDATKIDYYFDKVYIIDKSFGTIPIDDKMISTWKSNALKLNQNKFDLIGIRKELDSLEFKWLFSEYLDMVKVYYNFSSFILNNARTNTNIAEVKKCFNHIEMQFYVIQMHLNDLLKIQGYAKDYIKPEIDNGNLIRLINNQISEIKLNPSIYERSIPELTKPTNNTLKQEKVILNEIAIEHFLLETQFNVKLSDLN